MPNLEKYTPERAQEEAVELQDKIKSGKAKDYDDAEKLVDQERSQSEKLESSENSKSKEKNPEKDAENIELYKSKLSRLEEGFQRLVRIAQNQESERMNPSIDYGRLSGTLGGLDEVLHKKDFDVNEIAEAIGNITSALRVEPPRQRQGPIKMSEENFKKEMFVLKDTSGIVMEARRSFGVWERGKELTGPLQQLQDILDRRWQLTAKRLPALKNYLGQ